ncbi:hypothetical protein, partial [Mesorhizobium humile]|uniref:hypothetical protein n=1 Tax=Mesorhizobium humile TaxID=3072313 RepID=UPI002A24D376
GARPGHQKVECRDLGRAAEVMPAPARGKAGQLNQPSLYCALHKIEGEVNILPMRDNRDWVVPKR